ncbi:hypothetical protein CSQ92_09770 [Janthinobacterium sp. BJB446]|nr:hypothetical protein CSQ92_09770 [Janthinobacterium sp. BJB446]
MFCLFNEPRLSASSATDDGHGLLRSRHILLLLLCCMTACTTAPQAELQSYRDAFAQSKSVMQEVWLDHQQARDELARRKAQREKSAPAAEQVPFPPALVKPAPASIEHGSQMGKALETIDSYNELLFALAEGKSVKQVQDSARSFTDVLSSAVTLLPGAGVLINDVVGMLEQARSQEEFRKAVRLGAPVIVKIIDLFIDNASDYYTLRAALAEMDMARLKSQMAVRVGVLEKRVKLTRPGSGPWLLTAQKVNATLEHAGGLAARKTGIVLDGKCVESKLQACAVLIPEDLTETVLGIEQDVVKYQHAVEQMNAYHVLMQNYVSLLQQARQATSDLSMAVDRPHALTSQFQSLFSAALLVRKDLLRIRST